MSDKKKYQGPGAPGFGWDMGMSYGPGGQGPAAGPVPDPYAADPYGMAPNGHPVMQGMPYPPPPPPPWAMYGAPPPYGPGMGMPPHPMAPGPQGYHCYGPEPQAPNGSAGATPDFKGMHGLLDQLTKGNNPVASLARMLDVNSSDFWKGAAMGAVLVMVLSNDDVKDQLKGMLSGIMPGLNGEEEDSASNGEAET